MKSMKKTVARPFSKDQTAQSEKWSRKQIINLRLRLGDPILYSERGYSWQYLPSYLEAKEHTRDAVEMLRRARRPRKYPLTEQNWTCLRAACERLAHKLVNCRASARCGSLACPMCRRADAQIRFCRLLAAKKELALRHPDKPARFLTIIPACQIREAALDDFDAKEFTRKIHKAILSTGLNGKDFFGITEVSYERVTFSRAYYQPHAHIVGCFSDDSVAQLRELFLSERAIFDAPVRNDHVLKYLCKTKEKGHARLGESGARSRCSIPAARQRELALWFSRCDSSDFLIS